MALVYYFNFGRLVSFEIVVYEWSIRQASGKRAGKSEEPPVIPFDKTPVFVPTETLDELFEKAIQTNGMTLIQIAAPPIGPPIIIPIGALLNDGNVLLNDGLGTYSH